MSGRRALRVGPEAAFRSLVGVGGIGAGMLFALDGDHDLGRNESRPGRLLDARDYCKLHNVAHYPAVLLGAQAGEAGPGFGVLPVARIGDDDVGRRLRREMEAAGMDTRFVTAVPDLPTLFSVCFLYPDGSGGNITTSASAAAALTVDDVDAALPRLDRRTLALAVPEAPLLARLRLLDLAGQRGALRVAAFTSAEMAEAQARGALGRVDLLALNQDEAASLAGERLPDGDAAAFLRRCAAAVIAQGGRARIVVTAGERGAWAYENGDWTHCPALSVEVASTAGAGDALLGGILAGLAVGLPFRPSEARASLLDRPVETALELGALVAAFKVTSPHTIPPELDLDALLAFADQHHVALSERLARQVGEAVH